MASGSVYRYTTEGFFQPSDMARQAAQWQVRYTTLRRLASERGVLAQDAPDLEPKSNFFWDTIDILSRPNYAIAGVFDTLQGTGRRGQVIPSRILQELLGDTKIGTLIGIEDPQRETFGDVLEQGNWPDLRVSQVFGRTLPFKWDPGLRGTVGLGLDIFTDPTTYAGYGPMKGAFKIITRGGEAKWLNPKYAKAIKAEYDRALMATAKSVHMDKQLTQAFAAGDDAQIARALEEIEKRNIRARQRAVKRYVGIEERRRPGVVPVRKQIEKLELELQRLTSRATSAAEERSARIVEIKETMATLRAGLRGGPRNKKALADLQKELDTLIKETPQRAQAPQGRAASRRLRADERPLKANRDTDQRIKQIEAQIAGLKKRELAASQRLLELDQAADETIQDRIMRFAQRRVVRDLRRTGKLDEATRGTKGLKFAGNVIIPDEQIRLLTDPIQQATAMVLNSTKPTRVLMETFGEVRAGIDYLFSRDHGLARRIGGYIQDKQDSLNRMAAHDRNIREELEEILGEHITTEPQFFLLARALDNPDKYLDEWVEAAKRINQGDADWGRRTFLDLRDLMDQARKLDIASGHATEEAYADLAGRYFPHFIDGRIDDTVLDQWVDRLRSARRPQERGLKRPMGGHHQERRQFRSIDEFDEFKEWVEANKDSMTPADYKRLSGMQLNLDVREVIARRLRASYDAYEGNRFLRRVQAKYGFVFNDTWETVIETAFGAFHASDLEPIIARTLDAVMAGKRVISEKFLPEAEAREVAQRQDKFVRLLQRIDKSVDVVDVPELAMLSKEDVTKLIKRLEFNSAESQELWTSWRDAHRTAADLRKEAVRSAGRARAELRTKVRNRLMDNVAKATYQGDRASILALPDELRPFAIMQHLRNQTNPVDYAKALDRIGNDLFEQLFDNPKALEDVQRYISRQALKGGVFGRSMVLEEITINGKKFKTLLPEAIVKDLNKHGRRYLQQPEIQTLLKGWVKWTNFFKEWVTAPFIAFHVRNMYSNLAAMALRIGFAAFDPQFHRQAIDILRGIDGTLVADNGIRYTYDQVRRLMRANGIKTEFSKIADLLPEYAAKKSGAHKFAPRRLFVEKQTKAGTAIENEARVMLFTRMLADGKLPAEAAGIMKQFLFDYDNLSNFEKDVMRVSFPFYTWQSKNIRQQIRNLYERPGYVLAQAKPFRDRGPENDMLPEFRRGELKLKLSEGPNGSSWLFNLDLPIQNLDIIFDRSLQQTILTQLSFVNPLLKLPLEVGFDQEVFTGRSISGQQFMGNLGPVLRRIDKVLGGYLETEEVKLSDGTTAYKANGLKVYLLFKSWAVSRFLTDTARFDKMLESGGVAEGLWRLMTGLDFREFDLSEAQRNTLMNRYHRLEEKLIHDGYLRRVKASAPTDKGVTDGKPVVDAVRRSYR